MAANRDRTGTAAAPLKVLIVLGHPRGGKTLCGGLAEAFARGARAVGCKVSVLSLDALRFNPDVIRASPRDQPLEPDLAAARSAVMAADHLVLVYPTWWGTYPALLKGFLDRILVPGWAFEEIRGGNGYEGLLGGRTAELVTTMDTPAPVYSLLYRSPGRNAMTRATLGFCGMRITRHSRFGPVNMSTPARRHVWLRRAEALGGSLANGPYSLFQRLWLAVAPWLSALRLQFYPMTFFAYWIGGLLAARADSLDIPRFWAGYMLLFALEAATVFANDLEDEETDRLNGLWGPFNGGSRVLHQGVLSRTALQGGLIVALACAGLLAGLLAITGAQPVLLLALISLSAVLALGYTMPPLRLSYRMLGELDVGVTHSFMAILFGVLIQGGELADPAPWLIAIPLFLSILPAIILAGIPDHDADRTVGKRTVAVSLGIRRAISLAGVATVGAAIAMITVDRAALPGAYGLAATILAGTHSVWLVVRLIAESRQPPEARRIDATMVIALSYILWFCIPPLWRLAG